MGELEAARHRLMGLGVDYAVARRQKAMAELDYERARGQVFVELFDKANAGEFKLPAEDVRKGLANMILDEKVYETYLLSSAEVDALDKLIRVEQANLTGLQTELAQLRIEYTHA